MYKKPSGARGVKQAYERLLGANLREGEPAWLRAMRSVPPRDSLVRETTQFSTQGRLRFEQNTAGEESKAVEGERIERAVAEGCVTSRHKKSQLRTRSTKPPRIEFPEDQLRRTFYRNHPFEKERPRIVMEPTGQTEQDWSQLTHGHGQVTGENVIRHQYYLMQSKGLSEREAYAQATNEFYKIRAREEMEAKSARQEALAYGARGLAKPFSASQLAAEDRALRRSTKAFAQRAEEQNMRSAMSEKMFAAGALPPSSNKQQVAKYESLSVAAVGAHKSAANSHILYQSQHQVMPMAHHHHCHDGPTQLPLETPRRSPPRYACQQQHQQQSIPLRRSLSGGRIGASGTGCTHHNRARSHQRTASESLTTLKPVSAESSLLSRRGSRLGASGSRARVGAAAALLPTCIAALPSGSGTLPCNSLPSPPATASGDEGIVGSSSLEVLEGSAFRPRKRSLSVGGESACRDFFARQIEQYGLAALLTSPVGTCYLLASAVLSYSPEILLFYLEVEHFRAAAFGGEDRRTRYAKGLYKAFVSSRAPLEINISHAQRVRVALPFRSAEPVPAALFQETQAHAYALLEQEYALFRQRPLFGRMMATLSTAPQRAQHQRAVAAVYDALASTYGLVSLPASKPRLVESELPSFTKFADMDLTSSEMVVALPAWLCRTTVRLLGTPMPCSYDDAIHLLRASADPSAPPRLRSSPPRQSSSRATQSPPPEPPAPKLASKQKSFQRLRFKFQHDYAASPPHSPDVPLPPSVKSRWDSLWNSRRRKE
ncbi:mitochondrial ribosomal small subunit component [Coemansia sp. S146]|nr:mitochondrial ribosomal small subunit component [Coemansia sp. S146]